MDIGIDLGTTNVIMTMGKRGIVMKEASVIAVNKRTRSVIAVGDEAYKMIGRTHDYIAVIRPIVDGVISNDTMTEIMLREFILKISGKQLLRPRIIICVPSFITDVEAKAVVDSAIGAGSRKVFLIQEPIAAMMGAGIDVSKPRGNLIVDIGGGTTDVAVVSLNGIVTSGSIKVAGNAFDKSIIRYMVTKYKLLIGDLMAEQLKIRIGNVDNPNPEHTTIAKGKHLYKGVPESIIISEVDIYEALKEQLALIIEAMRNVLEETPPELVADICVNGVLLTGGGSLLRGLGGYIFKETGIKCRLAENPAECVAKGTHMAFDCLNELLDGFESVSIYNYR